MDLIAMFEGNWRLARDVADARAGTRLRFDGVLTARRKGAGLVLKETGTWTGGGLDGLAGTRRWQWSAEDGEFAVTFEDGRPFHRFRPVARGTVAAVHDCAPDRYEVAYAFALPGAWEACWQVRGPAKDYDMVSRYSRG